MAGEIGRAVLLCNSKYSSQIHIDVFSAVESLQVHSCKMTYQVHKSILFVLGIEKHPGVV